MEWPLVLFTIALQLACGLALAVTLIDKKSQSATPKMVRILGISIFPLTVVGIFSSLLHLGNPLHAANSLRNLGSSWLSREILFSGIFAFAALIYSYFWFKERQSNRVLLGSITTILGLISIISSSMAYLLPAQAAWNSGWVLMSFLGTTLLLGAFGALVLGNLDFSHKSSRTLVCLSVFGGLALIASTVWMLSGLGQVVEDEVATQRLQRALHLITNQYAIWFGLYVLLACVLPFTVMFKYWNGRSQVSGSNEAPVDAAKGTISSIYTLLFIAVLIGTVIGRALMYVVGVGTLPPF